MPVEFNIDAAVREAQLRMAERLLRAAVFFQTVHKQMLNVPNTGVRMKRKRDTRQIIGMSMVTGFRKGSTYTVYPNPSKPGEYSRKITGQGQSGVVYGPETADEVIANGLTVMIGHRAFMNDGKAFNYIVHHEKKMNRLGYAKTADTIRPQMVAILKGV